MQIDHNTLVAFAASHVNLPKDEVDKHRGQVTRLRDKLGDYIAAHPDYSLIKTVHSGSVAKGTALKSISDMDVAAYLDGSKIPSGKEADLISEIATVLRNAYGGTKSAEDFEEQTHSVKVHFHGSGLDIDVVPVVYNGGADDRGDLITKSGERVETSVRLHKEFVRNRRRSFGADFTQVVRFLKYWARAQKQTRGDEFRCKSFLLELIVAHLADNGLSLADYPSAVEGVFAWMVKTGMTEPIVFDDFGTAPTPPGTDPIEVIDPVNDTNNVCRTYTATNRAYLLEAANDAFDAVSAAAYGQTRSYSIDCWKEVFGPTFRG
jgi:tRNA nucleotidyltransferase (CCA-adding enzyme)